MNPRTGTDVLEMVQAVLHEALEIPRESIVPSALIIDELGAESIDVLDIRFRIESAFGIPVSDRDLETAFGAIRSLDEFRSAFTVGGLCDYVARRLEESDG